MSGNVVNASKALANRLEPVVSAPQRLLIVDEHRLFTELPEHSIVGERDLKCIGAAHDTRTALSMAHDLQPDVILMDVQLGDGDGLALTRQLTQCFPKLRVVVLASFVDDGLVRRAAEAGACALLAKDGELASLLEVIRTAPRGGFVVLADLISRPGRPAEVTHRSDPALTDADKSILKILAAGFDVQAIGRELDVSTQSCIARISEVLVKLRASTPLDAVVLAMKQGLVQWGPPR